MRTKKIDVKKKNLLVVGPLYDKIDKLFALEPLVTEDKIVVFLGDTCYPYEKFSDIPPRVNLIREFIEGRDAHYILGDKDLIYMQKTFSSNVDNHEWLSLQQCAIRFMFENQTSALVVHGGVLPRHTTWGELTNDLEIAFISNIPEISKPWPKAYNGRFGYVISSHPGTGENVEIYSHSIALDTKAYESDRVAVQEFGEKGLLETIYI